jgi:hypothetical protein
MSASSTRNDEPAPRAVTNMADPNDKRPLEYRRKLTEAEKYERDGWIGLAITLAVCAIVAFVYFALSH